MSDARPKPTKPEMPSRGSGIESDAASPAEQAQQESSQRREQEDRQRYRNQSPIQERRGMAGGP